MMAEAARQLSYETTLILWCDNQASVRPRPPVLASCRLHGCWTALVRASGVRRLACAVPRDGGGPLLATGLMLLWQNSS